MSGSLQCWGGVGGSTPKILISTGVTSYVPNFAVVSGALYGLQTSLTTPIIASGVISVTSNQYDVCAIMTGGALECWGQNIYGNVGNGTTANQPTPVTVIPSGVTQVDMNFFTTCAVVTGSLKCWGMMAGNGVAGNTTAPATIIASGVTSVKLGTNQAGGCALVNGAVECWGDTTNGLVGIPPSNANDIDGANGVYDQTVPVSIIPSGATSLAVGQFAACAIVNGALQCWGTLSALIYANNYAGMYLATPVGTGAAPNADSTTYITPTTTIPSGVTAVSLNSASGCAIVNGGLQCWGDNEFGQTGNGSYASLNQVSPVSVIASGVTQVSVGGDNTCAIVTGNVQCWGIDTNGAIGNGTSGTSAAFVTAVTSGATAMSLDISGNIYALVNGVFELINQHSPETFIAAGVSSFSTFNDSVDYIAPLADCAIVGGALQCWGLNDYRAVGNTTGGYQLTPTTVIPSGVNSVTTSGITSCAILTGGALDCWGSNGTTSTPTPVNVIASGVTAVTTNNATTCAIVGGALQCWGSNSTGAVGNNTTTNQSTPVTIIASGVTAAATDGSTTCAVVNGGLECWGSNLMGGVGNGTLTNVLTPVSVIASGVSSIFTSAAGTFCALMNTGALECWGRNDYFQVGNATNGNVTKPVTVVASGVSAVNLGTETSCAIVNGGLQCWGQIPSTNAANPASTYTFATTPMALIANGVTSVSVGNNQVCALVNGAVECLGGSVWNAATASSAGMYPKPVTLSLAPL